MSKRILYILLFVIFVFSTQANYLMVNSEELKSDSIEQDPQSNLSPITNITIKSFFASYQGVDIRLDWELNDETGINSFDLYRKIDNAAEKKIYTLNPTGALAYYFIDDNIYKSNDNTQTIVYKLIARSGQGNNIASTSIQHNPTAVQRSWGSIKSMFK